MKIIKKCTACKKDKSPEDFGQFHGKSNKQCNVCRAYHNNRWANNTSDEKEKRRIYQRRFKETNRDKNFRNDLLKKYNLSVDGYNKLLLDQKKRCAMCGIEFILDRTRTNINFLPCVDHCHRTNKVRGLLCRMCNIYLGHVESGFVDKAKEYLRVHESR